MSGWAPDCLGCGQEKGHRHLRLSNCILLSCPGGPQAERMRDTLPLSTGRPSLPEVPSQAQACTEGKGSIQAWEVIDRAH